MKKILTTIAVVIIATVMTALPVMAFAPIGDINVPYGTPTIDGTLSDGEWSEKILVNSSNATANGWQGEVPADFVLELYYAWDNTAFYLAGNIIDPTFNYSVSGDNYNGDALQISLNLGQIFKTADYERAIFYSFGCLEDGTVDVLRQESSDNSVIENCGYSKPTENGWSFELKLDWATLKKDVADKAGKNVDIKEGLKIDGLICYLDRDDLNALANAFFTSKSEPGGWDPDAFGITFNLVTEPLIPIIEIESEADEEAATEATTADVKAAASAPITTAAQTSDVVVIVLILAAVSGYAVIVTKRKLCK